MPLVVRTILLEQMEEKTSGYQLIMVCMANINSR